MKKNVPYIYYRLVIFTMMLLLGSVSLASALTSDVLIEEAQALDGKTIVYEGEVIHDIMHRGDHAWANISDGRNTIGVWCRSALLSDVTLCGGYMRKGDTVRVEGVFHRACDEHAGELDIHAARVTILKPGSRVSEKLEKKNLYRALAFFLATLLLTVFFRKRV